MQSYENCVEHPGPALLLVQVSSVRILLWNQSQIFSKMA